MWNTANKWKVAMTEEQISKVVLEKCMETSTDPQQRINLALAVSRVEHLSAKVLLRPYIDAIEPFYDWAFSLDLLDAKLDPIDALNLSNALRLSSYLPEKDLVSKICFHSLQQR